jgi:UDP-N-acetylglucosamine 4,6-dehydratase
VFIDKSILLTGGTGSFGKKFVTMVAEKHKPKRLVIFSRDELKQFEMKNAEPFRNMDCLRFLIGDVRDKDRLSRALDGIDYVVHAAALKQVPTAEINPCEAVKTNILGAQNLVDCCIEKGVKRLIALSTDKAANPVNLYGATKLVSDKLFVAANMYTSEGRCRFACVRYGNVMGSRGSVIPWFLKQRETGKITITDFRMTRFWLTLEQGVEFVLRSLERMQGGEIFVPKIPSMKIVDLAEVIAPGCTLREIGIRPGEKLHEIMIPEDDSRHTHEYDTYYCIYPEHYDWLELQDLREERKDALPDGFRYSSDNNTWWLTKDEMRKLLKEQGYPV